MATIRFNELSVDVNANSHLAEDKDIIEMLKYLKEIPTHVKYAHILAIRKFGVIVDDMETPLTVEDCLPFLCFPGQYTSLVTLVERSQIYRLVPGAVVLEPKASFRQKQSNTANATSSKPEARKSQQKRTRDYYDEDCDDEEPLPTGNKVKKEPGPGDKAQAQKPRCAKIETQKRIRLNDNIDEGMARRAL